MGYQLSTNESFSESINRIVLEQVDKALDNLKPTVRNKDEAIHDARVCVKKIRAILRLIRDSLGDKVYREEDIAYRDLARTLSKVRDNAAMLEVLDKLSEHFSDQLSQDAFASVRLHLNRASRARKASRRSAMTIAARSLREARKRIEDWPAAGHDQSLALGLRRVFKQGRRTFKAAHDDPKVKGFHEWRKQVKHLLYQARVLRPIWETVMKALHAELKMLSEYLNEDHDLAILKEKISEQLSDAENRTEIEALVALIDQRRHDLETSASLLGAKLFAEKPRALASRCEAYWQAWRSQVKDNSVVPAS